MTVPVDGGTLGWLSWRRELLAVEPVERPRWELSPPDPSAIREALRDAQTDASRRHQSASRTSAYLRRPYRWARASLVGAPVLLVALVAASFVWGEGLDGIVDGVADPDSLGAMQVPLWGLSFAVLCVPWAGALAWRERTRLASDTRPSLIRRGLFLWLLALALAPFTFGLSFLVLPAAVGAWVLLSRPKVVAGDGAAAFRAAANLATEYRRSRADLSSARTDLTAFEDDVRRAVEEAQREYDERLAAFREAEQRWSPFEILPVPEGQDIIAIGGSPVERGDLLHHFGAAVDQQRGGLWVIDLEGRDASDRLIAEALYRGRSVNRISAGDDRALVDLLDSLPSGTGKRSPLVEVLAAGLAHDAEGRVSSRSRDASDTLRRLARALQSSGGVTVARLHAGLDAVLGGGAPDAAVADADDFGLAADDVLTPDHSRLPPAVVSQLRATFTQQDRDHFHATWTDLRIKLETLLPEADDHLRGADGWQADADLGVVTVASAMPAADRELRTALAMAHHLELLRTPDGTRPAAMAVIAAEVLSTDQLRQLSEVAAAAGTQLLLQFREHVDEVHDLARGRRVVAAFGGHGAAAAEDLADLFGRDWVERLQSYQSTWSSAEAIARTETSGRSWSRADSDQGSRTDGTNSSTGWSDAGSTSSNGRSRGFTKGWSKTVTEGGSDSLSDSRTRTHQSGGARTHGVEYERRVTGAEISALPPFTVLLKHGDAVRVVDVKADLALPEQLLGREVVSGPEARISTTAGHAGRAPAPPAEPTVELDRHGGSAR